MRRLPVVLAALVLVPMLHAQHNLPRAHNAGDLDRSYTIGVMRRLADPVLNALANDHLHDFMPVEGGKDRAEFTHLEAFGRLLDGMAPWLELGPDATLEGKLREHYIPLA